MVSPLNPSHSPLPARDAYRNELTHVDASGDVRMVDVGEKPSTQRVAVAEGSVLMHPETQAMVLEDRAKKGDVLACARIAGIMAAKRCSDIIPMCHPLLLTKSKVEITAIPAEGKDARTDGRVGFRVQATCGVTGQTGIEMEALTAASCACLTIYDMCKAVDRGMEITDVHLLRKEGGRSGLWERTEGSTVPKTPEPFAVALVGYQNAGKTTLAERIIAHLHSAGLRVGSIKHHGHHGFDIDTPGKDSWRHAQAGSQHVSIIAPSGYAEYANTSDELALSDMLSRYTDVDIVIVEGYKHEGLPNIVVARQESEVTHTHSSLELINEQTCAIACDNALAAKMQNEAPFCPLYDHDDAQALAALIMELHTRTTTSA